MNKKKQIYRKLIAILLMVVVTLPVFLQPGHYLLIEHDHYHHSDKNSISEENQHLKCAIDDFQLTEVPVHPFLNCTQVICINIALKFSNKQIYLKRELNIPFSLRAPPFS